MKNDKDLYDLTITCIPEKGWVNIQADAVADLENPIIELSILSAERRTLASTLVMDAPSAFRVTLHPGDVEVGTSLVLQVKRIDAEDMSVETTGEYPFIFALG